MPIPSGRGVIEMAHAYTPGLRVTRQATIEKERILPLKGNVEVKVGDHVDADKIVAKTELPGSVNIVNVMGLLGCEADEVPELMLKQPGEKIKKDELIAETKPLLPFLKFLTSRVKSPIDGSVEKISDVTGQVILREPPQPVIVKAYINGEVTEVIPDEGVKVRTIATFIQGIFGVGGETGGEIVVAVEGPEEELRPEHIKPEHQGKVVVGGSYISIETIRKGIETEVAGIISAGMGDRDLKELLGYDLGVAITGHEDIGLTLVITEGFGHIDMAHRTFELLKEREGLRASISGATQIRAGVIRPEIIIALPENLITTEEEAATKAEDGVKAGNPVRIIREPNFGQLGRVKRLIPELMVMESETKVRVMEVTLANGTDFIVPRANVEIIED
jgi:hypothetical protein